MMKERSREGTMERSSRVLRNAHTVGALALEGVAIGFPLVAGPFNFLAGLEALHAGFWELVRRTTKRGKRTK